MDKQFFDDVVNIVRVAHYRTFGREINNDSAQPYAKEIIREHKYPKFVVQWLNHLQGEGLHPTIDYLKAELSFEGGIQSP